MKENWDSNEESVRESVASDYRDPAQAFTQALFQV